MPPLSASAFQDADADVLLHLPLIARASATTTSASTTATQGLSASDLIEEAEQHWNVSGTSILAAWGLTAVGSILILLLFSWARMRWKLIYLPRVKMRKQGKTPEEWADQQADLSKMTEEEKKRWKKEKERRKPACYPPEDPPAGRWVSKAPGAESGYFGWAKPTWRETMVELRAAAPRWCCLPFRLGERQAKISKANGEKASRTSRNRVSGSTVLFEQDRKMLSWLGLDAMVYLLFLRLLKYLFTTLSFLAILLAITNYYINTQTSDGSTSEDTTTATDRSSSPSTTRRDSSNISSNSNSTSTSSGNSTSSSIIENPQILTAANITGNGLIVHISFEWIMTTLIVFFVLKSSAYHLKLVQEWTHMNYNEVSFKTIMITGLSINPSPKEGITTISDARRKIRTLVLGDKVPKVDTSVWFATDNMNPLHERMEAFKKKHLNLAVKAVAMETIFGKGQGVFYDSCTKSLCGSSKSAKTRVKEAAEEKRAIELTQEQLRNGQLNARDTKLKGTVTSAFVTVPTARKCREILKAQRVKLKQAGHPIQRAPRSHNVLWRNLELDVASHRWHALVGKALLVFNCFLNTIPVMIITVLANLSTFIDRYPALAKLEASSDIWKAVFTVVAGVLPASISALFSYMLPYVMRRLSRWSGALTRGQLDKAVIRQLFVFLLVSNFVVFSLLGVVYESYLTISAEIGKESWSTIYESLGDIPAKVTRAYISESSYWLSWYPIRSFLLCLQMLQIPRMLMKIPQLLSFKTPHDLAQVTQPENFEYAIEYSHILFAMVVGVVYAPLAPIVVICAAIYFWTASVVHTNQLKYVEDSKETDGKCWKIIINRLLVATVFMQVLMALTVGLKTKSILLIILSALPILAIFLFKLYLRRHFHPDGEIFSEYIDAYVEDEQDTPDHAPIYEHELLKHDWMPRMKTVRSDRLMRAAKRRFSLLEELLRVGHAHGPKDVSGDEEKKERGSRRRKRRKGRRRG